MIFLFGSLEVVSKNLLYNEKWNIDKCQKFSFFPSFFHLTFLRKLRENTDSVTIIFETKLNSFCTIQSKAKCHLLRSYNSKTKIIHPIQLTWTHIVVESYFDILFKKHIYFAKIFLAIMAKKYAFLISGNYFYHIITVRKYSKFNLKYLSLD